MNFKLKIIFIYITIVLFLSVFLFIPVKRQVAGIARVKNSTIIVRFSQDRGGHRYVLHKGELIHLTFESNSQNVKISGVIQSIDSSFSTVYIQPSVQLKGSIASAGNSFIEVPVRIVLQPKNVLTSILEK